MARIHLAVVSRAVGEELASGRKSIESRFYRNRRVPFGRISSGDIVYFKLSGADVIGSCRVQAVRELAGLTPTGIASVRRRWGGLIRAPRRYWSDRRKCRYGVLIWLSAVRGGECPMPVPRLFGSGWHVLDPGDEARSPE